MKIMQNYTQTKSAKLQRNLCNNKIIKALPFHTANATSSTVN